jgi:hypothetical protein
MSLVIEAARNARAKRESRVQGILNENRSWKTRYRDLLEHLDSPNSVLRDRAMSTLEVMQNQAAYIESLASDPRLEATFTQNLGPLVPKVIDLVRIFYPNMVAHDLVDIQPLDRQNGEIFVIRPVFSNTAAGVTAGDQVFKTPTDGTYASEQQTTTLAGSGSGPYTATATLLPLRPDNVAIYAAGVQVGIDDGAGGIVGTTVSAGTVNYTSGAISVTFTGTPSAPVTAGSRYSAEDTPTNIRKLSLNLSTIPVQARPHPLRVDWSVQAQLAAAAHLDIDVPQTLADAVASFIKQERDVQLINKILSGAVYDASLDFNATAPTNYSRLARYAEIELKLNYAESAIQYGEGRGGVSWILCGTNAADIWRNCNGFEPSDVVAPVGPHKIGTLRDGTVAVIKNPFMNRNTYVIGFKGYVMGDAATILAEWIPLYATPVFQGPDLINQQGMTSLYHLENNQAAAYYRYGNISNYGA